MRSGASSLRTGSRWPIFMTLLVLVSTLGFFALADIENQLIYYWTPTELLSDPAAGHVSVRLGGLVESIEPEGKDGLLRFVLTDGTTSMEVATEALPPAMFRVGIGVVLEGRLDAQGEFQTHRLMVKHDNEYQAPDGTDARDLKEKLEALGMDNGQESSHRG